MSFQGISGVSVARFRGDLLDGFPHDLEVANDRILGSQVRTKAALSVPAVEDDALCGLTDVTQVELIVLHRARASRRTRSRR